MSYMNTLFPVEASVLSQQTIEEIIKSQYFPTPGNITCRLHYRGIHDTYVIFNESKTYYFKVFRYGLRTKEEIQAEIKLLLVLKECHIPANQPVMKKDGEYLIQFNSAEGIRYGVLYTSAGEKSSDEVEETDEYNTKLGTYIASIHKAWDTLDYHVNRQDLDIDRFLHKSMDHIRAYRQWYSFDLDFLEYIAEKTSERIRNTYSKGKSGYGICHGDINPGNLRFDSNDNY